MTRFTKHSETSLMWLINKQIAAECWSSALALHIDILLTVFLSSVTSSDSGQETRVPQTTSGFTSKYHSLLLNIPTQVNHLILETWKC